jgi:ribosomal protein S24E
LDVEVSDGFLPIPPKLGEDGFEKMDGKAVIGVDNMKITGTLYGETPPDRFPNAFFLAGMGAGIDIKEESNGQLHDRLDFSVDMDFPVDTCINNCEEVEEPKGPTEPSPTPAPAPPPVTEATMDLKVNEPAAFKETAFVQSVAEKTGVPLANIKVTKKVVKMEVGYKFKGNKKLSEDDVKSAIAKTLEVEPEKVEIISQGRRLADSDTETAVKARIIMEDIQQAQEVHKKLTSPTNLDQMKKALKEDAGIEVEPEQTQEVEVNVQVETEILSTTEEAVTLPTGDELKEVAEKSGASDMKIEDVQVVTFTTTRAVGTVDANTSSSTTVMLAYIVLSLAGSRLFTP